MGQELNLLIALYDAKKRGPGQNARCQKHDDQRLTQFLPDNSSQRREP